MVIAIAIGIFLFVALSVAACRAVDTLRAAEKADRKAEVTSYRGPVYSRHGNEMESK